MKWKALSEASVMKDNCYMVNGDKHARVDVFSQNNFLYISTTSIAHSTHKIYFTGTKSLEARNINTMGWVGQRPISANSGLKLNLLFCFYIFLGTVYFQASQNRTFINSYQVSESKIPTSLTGCSEFCS